MDDFRVGSVPSSDSYSRRPTSGAVTRKREKRDDESGRQQNDPADTFEPILAADDQFDASGESIEDYYLPSDPSSDSE